MVWRAARNLCVDTDEEFIDIKLLAVCSSRLGVQDSGFSCAQGSGFRFSRSGLRSCSKYVGFCCAVFVVPDAVCRRLS